MLGQARDDGEAGSRLGVLLRTALVILVYCVAFLALDFATQGLQGSLDVSLWFPPAGLSFALLLIFGWRWSPVVAVTFLAHLLLFRDGLSYPVWLLFLLPVLYTFVYAGAATFLTRAVKIDPRLPGIRDVLWFVEVGCLVAPLLAAGTIWGYVLAGYVPVDTFWRDFLGSWSGDATGIAVLAPVILISSRYFGSLWEEYPGRVAGFRWPSPQDIPETLLQVFGLALALAVAYGGSPGVSLDYAYLAFAPIVWVSLRGGFERVTLALLAVNVGVVILAGGTPRGDEPVLLQFGLAAITLVGLLFGALATEREKVGEKLRTNERRFRSLIENSSESVKICALDGTLRYASPAFETIFGYDPGEAVASGMNVHELTHPDDLPRVKEAAERAVDKGNGATARAEYRFRCADGSYKPVESVATFLLDEPAVGGVVINVRDITTRKKDEERLRMLESATDHANDVVMITESWPYEEPGPRIVYVNEAFTRMTGYDREDILGKTPRVLQGPRTDRSELNRIRTALSNWEPVRVEVLNYRKDGSEFWVEFNITPVADRTGRFTHWVSIQRENTERREIEQALRLRNRVVEASTNAILITDPNQPDNPIVYANPAFEQATGYPIDEVIGWNCRFLQGSDTDQPELDEMRVALREERECRVVLRNYRKDGALFYNELSLYPVFDAEERLVNYVGVQNDIPERRRAEEAVRESEERFRAVMEQAADAFLVHDLEGRILDVNHQACESLGYGRDELLDLSVEDIEMNYALGDIPTAWERLVATGEPVTVDGLHRRKDGTKFPVDVRVGLLGWGGSNAMLAIARDVTERRRLEDALKHSEALYRAVVEDQTELVSRFTSDFTLLLVNDAYCRHFGKSREELLGSNFLDLIPAGSREVAQSHITDLSLEQPVRTIEHPSTTWDGRERWMQWTDRAIFDDEDRVVEVQCVGRDITERKETEIALSESEERFRQLFEQSVDALLVHDEEGRYVDCNAQASRLLGYSREELLRMSVKDVSLGMLSDEERVRQSYNGGTLWQRALRGETGLFAKSIQDENRRKDGSTVFVEVDVGGVDYGGRRMVLVSTRDITERKRLEDALKRSEALYRAVVEDQTELICRYTPDMNITFVNDAYCRYFGKDREELMGNSFLGLIPEEERAGVCHNLERMVKGESFEQTYEHRSLASSGELRWQQWTDRAIRDGEGYLLEVQCVGRDITERKAAEDELKESEQRLRSVTSGAPVIMFALDRDGIFTFATGKGLQTLNAEPEDIVGRSVFEAHRDSPEIIANNRRALAGEEFVTEVEERGVTFDCRYSPLRSDTGEVEGVICVATDVSERKELERTLEHRAFHDPLTDLPNRTLFMDRLSLSLSRANRRREPVAVLFLDLDDFKVVNDSLGHRAGDELLIGVARRLEGCLRPEDTLARFGGDEFAVLLEGTDLEGAGNVARRISLALEEPFRVGDEGRETFASASVGIALADSERRDVEELLKEADTALYGAKDSGKSRHEAFEPRMGLRARNRLRLYGELRKALEREEFVVHYQPVVRLETGAVVGLEALVRWEHPERGLVQPTDFISDAEETGLIVPLGRLVLEEVCRQVHEWRLGDPSMPTGAPPPWVSVNLSARQLTSDGLVESLEDILLRTGLDPSGLRLEITESATIEDDGSSAASLERLKDLGVGLAVDDFGTGYSSISYLTRFPVDTVKIDRSITAGLGKDHRSEAVVSAIITLARSLGEEVVAEGVEDADQLRVLQELGCELGQGELFWSPLTADRAGKLYLDASGTRVE